MTALIHAFLAQQGQQGPPLQPLPHPRLPDPTLVDPGLPWWIYVTSAVLVLLLSIVVVWMLMRPGKPVPPPMKKPWSEAMSRLRDIQVKSMQQPPAQTAAEVSETLRVYFFDRYKIPAPFRTSHELFVKSASPATSSRLQRYAPLAELWDQLAFAPVPANPAEADDLVKKAIAYLEDDRP